MTALLFIVTFAICLNVKRLFGSRAYESQSFRPIFAPNVGLNFVGIVLAPTPSDLVVTMLSARLICLD
jgi:hypothetical protein